jgi:hypothetical protein
MIFTATFWLETLERALKSSAQFIIGAWGVGDAVFNLCPMDWTVAAGAAATGFTLSVLTSIASAPIGRKASPSLVQGEPGLDVDA